MWFDNPELLPHRPNVSSCMAIKPGVDSNAGSQRSSNHPVGLLVDSQEECCAACDEDLDCTAWIFASDGPVAGAGCDSCNCWPMSFVPSTHSNLGRIVGGAIGSSACLNVRPGVDTNA